MRDSDEKRMTAGRRHVREPGCVHRLASSRPPIPAHLKSQLTRNSISGNMTATLTIYSATFMRYALAVSPKNYLLFACHAVNFSAQLAQGYRYLNYWKYVPLRHTPSWHSLACSSW